jgi:uncharacterized YigZ family protein
MPTKVTKKGYICGVADSYQTILGSSNGAYKERGSKFLAFAYHVQSVEDALERVAALKHEYYDARHHCWAYRLGSEGEKWRAVDDSEPSGTAGRPILGRLISERLTDVIVVVVRYFGGTKLGTAGLINAYSSATADALANAKIEVRNIEVLLDLNFGYPLLSQVIKYIKQHGARIVEQRLENHCQIRVAVARDSALSFHTKISTIASVDLISDEKKFGVDS